MLWVYSYNFKSMEVKTDRFPPAIIKILLLKLYLGGYQFRIRVSRACVNRQRLFPFQHSSPELKLYKY